mgnify:CR=1 FL=1
MILLPHLLIGAVIGAKVQSLPAVFILSFISHFIADKLPHWEYLDKELTKFQSKKEWLIFLTKATLDFGLGIIIILYFFWQSPLWPAVAVGALASVLPDFLIFLNCLLPKIKTLKSYRDFHHRNHFKKGRYKISLSIFSEALIISLAIYLIAIG